MLTRVSTAARRAWHLWQRRLYASADTEQAIIRAFHDLYFERGKIDHTGWAAIRWRGRPVAQCPTDLLTMGRLIQEQCPVAVLEIGTGWGGSALFYADNGAAPVVTVDWLAYHESFDPVVGIQSLTGDSLAPEIQVAIRAVLPEGSAMVVLDGNHEQPTVYAECQAYARYVRVGAHLIVCDTHFPGAADAVEQFLAVHPDFVQDRDVEPMLTFNPGGWLKRVR